MVKVSVKYLEIYFCVYHTFNPLVEPQRNLDDDYNKQYVLFSNGYFQLDCTLTHTFICIKFMVP